MRTKSALILAAMAVVATAADSELTNYKSGIDVTWGVGDGSDKGTAYAEEYFYHDKFMDDHKVVYLKSTTAINMAHNARNNAQIPASLNGGQKFMTIGVNGRDGVPDSGDEGIIRYKIDRDRQYYYKWAANSAGSDTAYLLPAYTAPFTLASQTFESGVPVVGTTGSNGASVTSKSAYYYRGMLDSVGDEWHVLSYADDDREFLWGGGTSPIYTVNGIFVDQAWYASDGKTVLLVVNPKTPCFTARVTGTGQFYTTPPKAYFTPKIVDQTTYIAPGSSGTVTIELRDINGNNVFYRINGGSFTDAGAATVTLTDSQFSNGSNTLEYYYAGNAAYTKTRTVVKNPAFPSAGEPHGNYLWVDSTGYATALSRITRSPYSGWYLGYRNRGDNSGQDSWDARAGQGRRDAGGYYHLENAFVAKVEGWTFTRSGAAKSHGQYAKEMVLETSRNIDPIGFEMQHSSDAIPNRELHYRGYYDSLPVLKGLFAYDILIANFRSDQVSGGVTPIEDYFIRDRFASFAYEGMQWSADMCLMGSPGNTMWGCARMMTSQSIAMVLREYSTPYYGTSGFGTVQTTYPLCPYESDQYTWKQALFDGTATRSAYPNLKWYSGLSDIDPESLLMYEGQTRSDIPYPLGTWFPKAAYMSSGLMGIHLQIWANMAKLWGGGKTDPRLEIAFDNCARGNFFGAVDPYPQTPGRVTNLLLMNTRWPNVSENSLPYVQGLPSTDPSSDDKSMQDAGVFGFAWYDDSYFGEGGGADTTPPTPSSTTWANAPHAVADRIEGTAVTTTDAGSPPVAYVFSVVLKDATPVYDIVQSTPDLTTAGLTPGTQYDVQAKVRDAVGNYTTASTKVTVTTNAADVRTYRNPRNRRLFGR